MAKGEPGVLAAGDPRGELEVIANEPHGGGAVEGSTRDDDAEAVVVDPVWYFACGSNMNDRAFRVRRKIKPLETRSGRLKGYRLRFTAAGGMRPGKPAPANVEPNPQGEVFGVSYRLPLTQFIRLDSTEGRQYRYLWTEAEDMEGNRWPVVTCVVDIPAPEGKPSLPYMRPIREGARQRGLPAPDVEFLEKIECAE